MLNQWSPAAPLQNITQKPTRKGQSSQGNQKQQSSYLQAKGWDTGNKCSHSFANQRCPRMCFKLCMFLSWLQIGKQKLTKERLFRSIEYKQISYFSLFFFFFGWTTWLAESYSQPGIKPVPLAVEAGSLNHWTSKQVPKTDLSLLMLHGALEISADFSRIFTIPTFVCIIFW